MRAVAPAALRHRLVLGYEAVADGVTADDLVDQLLDAVRAPGAGVRGAGVPAASESRDPCRRLRTDRTTSNVVNASDLLDPGLLAQLERLQLATRRRLAGRFSGEHRSPALRRVASTSPTIASTTRATTSAASTTRCSPAPGKLFIRLFEAEDDVTVRIVLDRSASMGIHGKLDQAVRMAAAIGFIALLRRDTVIAPHRAGGGVRRGGSPDVTPPGRCSRRWRRSTPPGRPTSSARPVTCSPARAAPASPS